MVPDEKRVAREGFGFGMIAGVVLLAAEMMTWGPGAPLRVPAVLVLGFGALESSLGTTYLVGLVVHLLLAGIFGLVYAEIEARLPAEPRRHNGIQIGVAVTYAALLWLVSFELFGAWLFPELVTAARIIELPLMVLFYGVPLGWMFAAAERRTPQILESSVG
jgi:hypothetical protein